MTYNKETYSVKHSVLLRRILLHIVKPERMQSFDSPGPFSVRLLSTVGFMTVQVY